MDFHNSGSLLHLKMLRHFHFHDRICIPVRITQLHHRAFLLHSQPRINHISEHRRLFIVHPQLPYLYISRHHLQRHLYILAVVDMFVRIDVIFPYRERLLRPCLAPAVQSSFLHKACPAVRTYRTDRYAPTVGRARPAFLQIHKHPDGICTGNLFSRFVLHIEITVSIETFKLRGNVPVVIFSHILG